MKKALAFIAVAAIAATTQAATIKWSSGTITTPDGQANASTTIVSASLFLIDATTYNALDLSTAEKQKDAIKTYLAKTADATATSKKNGTAIPETTTDLTGVANSQYAVLIYSYGSGTDAVYKIGKATDFVNDLGKQEGTAANIANQGGSWQSVSVPEPTTVALLALGLAAVGLKRKLA